MAVTLMERINLPDGPIDDNVYVGFWLNRSLGNFRGATLTLDRRTGGILIAFIALFVGATARSLWKLIRFMLHMKYASAASRDGVYHQRQAILRNIPIATDAAIQSLQLGHVWRHRAQEPWARAFSVVLVALVISVASTAIGKALLSHVSCSRSNTQQEYSLQSF